MQISGALSGLCKLSLQQVREYLGGNSSSNETSSNSLVSGKLLLWFDVDFVLLYVKYILLKCNVTVAMLSYGSLGLSLNRGIIFFGRKFRL